MERRQIAPGIVALSIVAVVALVLGTFLVDRALFTEPPFVVDGDLSIEEYESLFIKQRFEYAIWTLENNRRHFEWNLRSTKYIFWLSLFISISGISFAFWQFAQAAQFDRQSSEADEVTVKTQMATMSFRTRSVASLVLMISVVYLMIYVAFLYPIRNAPNALVGEQASEDARAAAPQPEPALVLPPIDDLGFDPLAAPEDLPGEGSDDETPSIGEEGRLP